MSEEFHIQPCATASVGKYRILAQLGRGGMAEVDLALCRGAMGFNKLVVIKRILPHLATDPEFMAMFLDEARLAARLNHPNVVQTHETGEEDGGYFMAMEYLEGQPFNRIRERVADGEMPLAMVLRLFADVLAGLHHAHELVDYDGAPLGVVHRDVSPQNIFVTYDGVVKVVDFGIAQARRSMSETQIGVIKGKVAYMSPEQARMDQVDRRADIFAVGVMLWEAATGARLWAGKADGAILMSLLAGEAIPSPRSIKPKIPERLEAIILKALSPDREKRHATAAELRADIESFLDDAGSHVLSHEIGEMIAERFAPERAKMKAIIEQQLTSPDSGTATAIMPAIGRSTTTSSIRPRSSVVSTAPEEHGASQPAPPPPSRARLRSSTSQRLVWMVGGAGILVAACAAAIWAQPTQGVPVSLADAATPAPAAVVTPASEPARRDEVELDVSVWPHTATISIDDRAMVGNPFKGRFARDSEIHRLRIEAPGFTPRVEDIALDRSRELERVLVRRPTTPAAPAPVLPEARPREGTERAGTTQVDGRIVRTDLL